MKDPKVIWHAAEALRALLSGPLEALVLAPGAPYEQAVEELNHVVEHLNLALRARYGGAAAAIEIGPGRKRPCDGGRALLYWDGLHCLSNSRVLQPILNSPLAVRIALPELLPDLLIQLEDEEET